MISVKLTFITLLPIKKKESFYDNIINEGFDISKEGV